MQIFGNLKLMMEQMLQVHKSTGSKDGCAGLLLFRRPNGKIMVFQTLTGFKVIDFIVSDECDLSIDYVFINLSYGMKKFTKATARLVLHELSLVEIYAHQAYFYSNCGIDFTYIANTPEIKDQLIHGWRDSSSTEVIGRWSNGSADIDNILNEIGHHKTMRVSRNQKIRNIDMET